MPNQPNARSQFLAFAVGPTAIAVAAMIYMLPPDYRVFAVLWLFVGIPMIMAVVKVFNGYAAITRERMAHHQAQPAPARVERPQPARDGLRVVTAQDRRAGQVRL